jgi:DNA-binding transcriptional ArsR family regulator
MLSVTVRRQMAQRRSLAEVQENVEYLANLPRITSLLIQGIDITEPEQDGLLYNYSATIRYKSKENAKSERIRKDKDIMITRIRRACEHKRWGRAMWWIEGEAPIDGKSVAPVISQGTEDYSTNGVSFSNPVQATLEQRRTFSPNLPEDDVIQANAEKFNMVSDATRLKVMLILAHQERNVTELCEDLGSQSQPAVSHHLAILRHARLAEQRRDGKHNYYNLTDEGLELAVLVGQLFD